MASATFVSPEPVEVAQLPWLEELAIKNDMFSRVLPGKGELPLDELEGVYVGGFDYLRQAAVEIGKVVLKSGYGFEAGSTLVDIRSGAYDPRVYGDFYAGPHFDVDPSLSYPVPVLVVATDRAGEAAVGEIDIKDQPKKEPEYEGWVHRQAKSAKQFSSLFDTRRARMIPLKPSTLYYMPRRCVHSSPTEFGPYGRNFFRFKDLRPDN